MKSLKDYSLNLSEKEYHAYPAWSYSLIARYAREGFSAISDLHVPVEQNDAMKFGSLFDCMLTRSEDVADEFVIGAKVPPAEKAVLDALVQVSRAKNYLEVTDGELQNAITITGYQPRWKFETQKDHIDVYSEYYNIVRSGKTVVSEEDWSDAAEMVRVVKTDEYLSQHFNVNSTSEKEFVFQPQFKIDYIASTGKIELKIMPDMLEVDHENKTIQPWDIKTSGMPGFDWFKHFVKMRYDIQAQLYTDVLFFTLKKIPEYSDYKILPYLFMDISRVDKVPVTYNYDPTSESQYKGLSFESDGRVITFKHYRQLLDEILEYESTMTKVPKYITTTGPNDLVELLSSR